MFVSLDLYRLLYAGANQNSHNVVPLYIG